MNVKQLALSGVSVLGLLLFILYSIGIFGEKIHPGKAEPWKTPVPPIQGEFTVKPVETTPYHRSVGTVNSQIVIYLSPQIRGVVQKLFVKEGANVKKGDLLVKISDEEFRTRLVQAKQGLAMAQAGQQQAIQMRIMAEANYSRTQLEYQNMEKAYRQAVAQKKAAEAAFKRAKSEFERAKNLFQKKALTKREYEAAEAAFQQAKSALEQATLGVQMARTSYESMKQVLRSAKAAVEQAKMGVQQAKARVEQAKAMVKEAEIALGYTEIRAPEDGTISRKFVEVGHLVWPGKVLLHLQKNKKLQLEAEVPESIRNRIHIGQNLKVVIESANYELTGTVTEIIPSANPRSRTFLVKVKIPYKKGLYPGMFGSLYVPLGKEKVLLIPKGCVRRIGQYESVFVKVDGNWLLRYIRTGKEREGQVEVLSGLKPKDVVAILKKEEERHG